MAPNNDLVNYETTVETPQDDTLRQFYLRKCFDLQNMVNAKDDLLRKLEAELQDLKVQFAALEKSSKASPVSHLYHRERPKFRGKRIVCFLCRQRGHIAKFCRAATTSLRRNPDQLIKDINTECVGEGRDIPSYMQDSKSPDMKGEIPTVLVGGLFVEESAPPALVHSPRRRAFTPSPKPKKYCTTCEEQFVGSYYLHRANKIHRFWLRRKYPKVEPYRRANQVLPESEDYVTFGDGMKVKVVGYGRSPFDNATFTEVKHLDDSFPLKEKQKFSPEYGMEGDEKIDVFAEERGSAEKGYVPRPISNDASGNFPVLPSRAVRHSY